ncbi:uncharacterized protein VTP21DRAFT_1660 [Calcarisporiella thermophila]|uniref:uncharacterized protein n=1 Tax=Calcarisporiella thermophila TaxID=911321 RepID=UPI0037449953
MASLIGRNLAVAALRPSRSLLASTYSTKSTSSPDELAVTRQESHIVPADVVSGVPESLRERTVRIFQPARTALQQGTHNTEHWRLDFDIPEQDSRWENPLMGWASTADAVHAMRLKFPRKEDAILFAEKQGWAYYIEEPKPSKFERKVYADNFKFTPNKLRLIKTK